MLASALLVLLFQLPGAHAATTQAESPVGVIDTVRPRVTGVTVASPRQASIAFSKNMLSSEALTPTSYTLSGDKGNLQANPSSVSGADKTFTLNWNAGEMLIGGQAVLTVGSIRDTLGNSVDPAHNSGSAPSRGSYPTGVIAVESGGTGIVGNRNVTLSLSASDEHSAVTKMRFSNDGVAWSPLAWADYASSYAWTLAEGPNGARTVYAQFRDAAGNASTATISATVNLQVVRPTVTVSGDGAATNTTKIASIIFSEVVYDFVLSDIQVLNGTASDLLPSGPAAEYSVAILGVGGEHTVQVSIPENVAVNGGGNANVGSAVPFSFYFDSVAPSGTASVSPTFQTGFVNTLDVQLVLSAADAGSGVDRMRFSNDGVNWSPANWSTAPSFASLYNWSLAAGPDGARQVYVQFRDVVGNVSSIAQAAITLDVAPPQPTLLGDTTPATDKRQVSINFGETVHGFSLTDIAVVNGAASNLQPETPAASYTADIQGAVTGTVTVSVGAAAAQDRAGNYSLAAAAPFVFEFSDPRPPAPVLDALPAYSQGTTRHVSWTNHPSLDGQSLQYLVQCHDNPEMLTSPLFNVLVTSGDKEYVFGELDPLTHGSAYWYRVRTRRASGDMTWSGWSNAETSTQDAQPPGGAISLPPQVESLAVLITVEGEDPVSGVAAMRFSNDGTNWLPVDWAAYASQYSWTLAPGGSGPRTVYAQFRDGAGNSSTAAIAASTQYAASGPAVSISGDAAPTNAVKTINIVFSETVYGFSASGVTVANGMVSNVQPASPAAAYTADILGTPGEHEVTVSIPAAAAANGEGAPTMASAAPFVYYFDSVPPSGFLQVIPSFQEGFVNSLNVQLAVEAWDDGSDVARMRFSNDNSLWTPTWDAAPAYAESYAWTLAAGADGTRQVYAQFRDGVGNASTATILTAVSLDTSRPAVVVSGDGGLATEARTLSISFTETVYDFSLGGIVVTNGVAENLRPTSPASLYEVDVVGAVTGQVIVFVPSGVAPDRAGNMNTEAAEPFTFVYSDGGVPAPILEALPSHSPGLSRTVHWTPGLGAELFTLRYQVECYANVGLTNLVSAFFPVLQGVNQHTFSGLVDGQTYWYRARARAQDDVWSSWSAVVSSTQDAQSPVFSAVTASPSMAAPGDVVRISFTASEPLAETPQVAVNGNPAQESAGKAVSYVFRYEVRSLDALGPAEIVVTGNDLAGNPGSLVVSAAFTVVDQPVSVPLRALPCALALLGCGAWRSARARRRANARKEVATTRRGM